MISSGSHEGEPLHIHIMEIQGCGIPSEQNHTNSDAYSKNPAYASQKQQYGNSKLGQILYIEIYKTIDKEIYQFFDPLFKGSNKDKCCQCSLEAIGVGQPINLNKQLTQI